MAFGFLRFCWLSEWFKAKYRSVYKDDVGAYGFYELVGHDRGLYRKVSGNYLGGLGLYEFCGSCEGA